MKISDGTTSKVVHVNKHFVTGFNQALMIVLRSTMTNPEHGVLHK